MRCGVELIVLEIALCPVEIRLREIERRRLSSTQSCTYGKSTGVGKSIEHRITCTHSLTNAQTVVALIEEDALGVAAVERDLIGDIVFTSQKGLG